MMVFRLSVASCSYIDNFNAYLRKSFNCVRPRNADGKTVYNSAILSKYEQLLINIVDSCLHSTLTDVPDVTEGSVHAPDI